jgi:hypothetical protein
MAASIKGHLMSLGKSHDMCHSENPTTLPHGAPPQKLLVGVIPKERLVRLRNLGARRVE